MKKEAIIAIVFGIVLGSILAVFLIAKNKERLLEKNKTITPLEKGQMSQAKNGGIQQLEITDPGDKTIVYKNTVTIKGRFTKNSLIIIQSPIKDMVIKNDREQFNVDFPLALGENVIRIGAYPENKQLRSQEKEMRVYYFTEQL